MTSFKVYAWECSFARRGRLVDEWIASYRNSLYPGCSMTLKASFASVLRSLRSKRNITQRDFADTTSRTYLSKLELGKSSITLDKLEQVSERLGVSPLTLMTLTLSEDTGESAVDLISKLSAELADLQQDGGLTGLKLTESVAQEVRAPVAQRRPRASRVSVMPPSLQTELAFID